jgi:tRNA A-37 threonylcarbamoyl transferase component Bud32
MARTQRATRDPLRVGSKLDKYRVEKRLSRGAYADVYQAFDTVEGIRVALKIPHARLTSTRFLEEFRKEVRLVGRLDHPNILPVKNASFLDGRFVIVFPLGERTLADRMTSRISLRLALDYAEQMLDAVAHAHENRVLHCDIKPENFILFPGNRLRLADFGIARLFLRTVQASGSGTVGYVAPEQAMGKPTFQSDVFSLGLIFYRMLSGKLPEWPFTWPPPGHDRLRRRLHPEIIQLLRRALSVDPARRFQDAGHMLSELRRVKRKVLAFQAAQIRRRRRAAAGRDWQEVRYRQFQRTHGRVLKTRYSCARCHGPVSEPMRVCPWCGATRPVHREETRFPARCPRCHRGVKLDWRFCPWCYGPGVGPLSDRQFSDVRYAARCGNPRCTRKLLMPFMRYCPWCHRAVRGKWAIPGSKHRCPSCGWGVLPAYWSRCPWCGTRIAEH